MLRLKKFVFNPWEENTYIIFDETKSGAIIDCGCIDETEQNILLEYVNKMELKINSLLQTHLHLDHIFGYPFAVKTFGIKAYANKNDEFLLEEFNNQISSFGINFYEKQPSIGTYIEEGDFIKFGNTELLCIHVPGHSPGGICFYNEKNKILFSGDCIFQGSIGRTDLNRGNYNDLINNLKNKILILPEDVKIFPGHGPSSNIGFEKKNNPFLNSF